MLFRSFFIGIIFLCIVFSGATQPLPPVYYDANWKECDVSTACYLSKINKTDSGYYRQDYFVNNGSLQMAALYEDSDCKIENGYANYFYANGYPSRIVKMLHGKAEGVDISYHNNGRMADSGVYHNGRAVGDIFSWHYNGYMADSITHVSDSISVHVSWFDNGGLAAAGREINGKKTGSWVFYHHNGNKAAKEMYEAGKRISVQHFDESGNEIVVDTNRNEKAAYIKGGLDTWKKYLAKALHWPTGYTLQNVSQVVLQVEMTIAEDGSIQNVYVMNPIHPVFDKEADYVISKGPKWMPAIQHNLTVQYRFRQSVTFAQQ